MRSRALCALLIAFAASAQPARAATPGALTQLAGPLGCVADALAGCTRAYGLDEVSRLAASPDGAFVYTASSYDGRDHAVTTFARDPATGALTPRDCVGETARPPCAKGRGLRGAIDLALSPDGLNVYVAAPVNGSKHQTGGFLAVLRRDPVTGGLTQLPGAAGCIGAEGRDGCAPGRAMAGLGGVAVSPDGTSVYATAANSNAVLAFARDPATGALRQLDGPAGCIRDGGGLGCATGRRLRSAVSIVVSPDGRNAYAAASFGSAAVTAFSRDPATGRLRQLAGRRGCVSRFAGGRCAQGHGLRSAVDVAISPDGANVYAAAFGSNSVAVLARDPATGGLRQAPGRAGCVSASPRGPCTRARGLRSAAAVTVTPDGRDVYAAGTLDSAVAVFARGPGGRLTQLDGRDGCVGGGHGCRRGRALGFAFAVLVSPDGRNVYAAGLDDDAVGVFARTPFGPPAG